MFNSNIDKPIASSNTRTNGKKTTDLEIEILSTISNEPIPVTQLAVKLERPKDGVLRAAKRLNKAGKLRMFKDTNPNWVNEKRAVKTVWVVTRL